MWRSPSKFCHFKPYSNSTGLAKCEYQGLHEGPRCLKCFIQWNSSTVWIRIKIWEKFYWLITFSRLAKIPWRKKSREKLELVQQRKKTKRLKTKMIDKPFNFISFFLVSIFINYILSFKNWNCWSGLLINPIHLYNWLHSKFSNCYCFTFVQKAT